MNVSSIYSYNAGIGLISALYPSSQVTSSSALSSVLAAASAQSSISSLGRLLGDSEALQSAASALASGDLLSARQATVAKSTVASASATAATPLGSYALQVDQLAQAQTLSTAAQTSSLTPLGSGATTLQFGFANGSSQSVKVAAGDNTLSGIASAINAANIGISAKVVSGQNGYQLTLTGQSGAANAFTVTASGNAAVGSLLGTGGAGTASLTSTAQDARGTLNGVGFSASTNQVATATSGLTLQLAATGSTTLKVASTVSSATTAVERFVDAYNAVQQGLGTLAAGSGNATLTLLQDKLTATLGQSGGTLASIGISQQSDGTLALDRSKFAAALTSNAAQVASLFADNGIADRVATLSSGALSASSLLQSAASGLDSASLLGNSLGSSYLGELGGYGTLGSASTLAGLLLNSTGSSTSSSSSSDNLLTSILSQQSYGSLIGKLYTQQSLASLF